jgi:hypothetical protein
MELSKNKSIKKLINFHKKSQSPGIYTSEKLSNYTHLLLKKNSKITKFLSQDEIELFVLKIKNLFVFIDEVDVFFKFYYTFLTQRLLSNNFIYELEIFFMNQMKVFYFFK